MKKIAAILLTVLLLVGVLTGCGGKDRELYSKVDLADYVEVKDYIGIEIDTNSDAYAEYYMTTLNTDVQNYGLYKTSKDVVESGDTVTIDYEGKIDGVAFDGGSAEKYDLKIGSNTFIDGFEEGLVGMSVGETRDVTAIFPTPYSNNPSLAGKEAVFTVSLHYINKVALDEEEIYDKMNFDTVEDYIVDINDRAMKSYILNVVCDSAKIKNYPEKDSEKLVEAMYETYVEIYKSTYGADLEEILAQKESGIEDYKARIESEMLRSLMNVNMVMYYILDAENLEIYQSTVESQEITQPAIAESYAVQDIVIEYLYDNAVIK